MAFVFTVAIRANMPKGDQGDIIGREDRADAITIETLESFVPLETKRFDKPLHDYHTEILGKDCKGCHHVKGKETSCRKCHKEADRKKLISMKNVSHLSCIGCHREMSGPVNCNECHTEKREDKMGRSDKAPISTQTKPDVMHEGEDPDRHRGVPVNKMGNVYFDHEIHREYLDKCDIPLRSESGSCTETCHAAGSKQGKMVTTDNAMHEIDNKKGCVGCHEDKKKNRECAGCHGVMERGKNFNTICMKCHVEAPENKGIAALERESKAAKHHGSRRPSFEWMLEKDIPEKVIIDKLSDQYGAVELPHRRIIDSVLFDINKSKLASHFHNGKETICLGCHHNSPKGKTLRCYACHSISSDDKDLSRPGLKVAYHQQCIGCHELMGIESPKATACVDCHRVINGKTN